jgi:8-amino-7-oxononanoate synthase
VIFKNRHNEIPVAIVGMGCRFPGSPDVAAFWRTVRDRKTWMGPVPRQRWDHDLFFSENGAREHNKTYANRVALIDDVDHFAPEFFGIMPRRARVMDPQQRLFLDVVRAALEDAGYARGPGAQGGLRTWSGARTGVFVGATVSDFMDILIARMKATLFAGGEFGAGLAPVEDAWRALTRDLVPLQAYSLVGTLMNMVAANVSQCFDFGGPAFTMDAACSSALVALHEAVVHLRAGLCDGAVVGGVYLILAPDNIVAFSRIGAISQANACLPFDKRADGFVIGEGLGAVLLKRLDDALKDGDRIHAVIRGIGMNNDGKAEGPMTPRKEGQLAVLERAYEDASLSPLSIEMIEAHGTATPVGDATEVAALAEFRGRPGERPCAISSVKANIGHSMSAAGMAGLLRGALSLGRKRLTPQAGYEVAREELELEARGFVIPMEGSEWTAPQAHPRRAGVNSFGFGGTNVHVVLEEAPSPGARPATRVVMPASFSPSTHVRQPRDDRPRVQERDTSSRPELFLLSAPNQARLRQHAGEVLKSLADQPELDLADVSWTLCLRHHDVVRAGFVAASRDELAANLGAIAGGESAPGLSVGDGEIPEEPVPVAFLFAGQGLQAPGLCRDLYERFPAFRRALDRLVGDLAVDGRPLLSYIYGQDLSAGAHERAMADLTRTEICQPIMAALGLALSDLCEALGVSASVVLGHSLGEFAAAAAAGVIEPALAVSLLAERGRLIAELPLPDKGAMAAVLAGAAAVETALHGIPDVAIANINHPKQTVISGSEAGVERALAALSARGDKTRKLRVSHGFHSPLMGGIRPAFTAMLDAAPVKPASRSVVSAIAPGLYPDDPIAIRALFADHASSPVNFVAALEAALDESRAQVFVQMGGGNALATMARQTLADRITGGAFLTAAAEGPDEGRTFFETLASLYVRGVVPDFRLLFEGRSCDFVTLAASLLDTRSLWPVKHEEPREALTLRSTVDLRTDMTRPSKNTKLSLPSPASLAASAPDSQDATSGLPEMGASVAPAAELAALFRQQMALLDAQAQIIRQQNDLLARGSVAPSSLAQAGASLPWALGSGKAPLAPPLTVTMGAIDETTSHGATHPLAIDASLPSTQAPSPASMEATILELVARITATQPDDLSASTRLGADLGFDSLMVVELSTALAEVHPGLEVPRRFFSRDVSIRELARQVSALLADGAADDAGTRRELPMQRLRVAFTPVPLPEAHAALSRGAETREIEPRGGRAIAAPPTSARRFLIVANRPEWTSALVPALAARGLEGHAVEPEALAAVGHAAHVVDLRGLEDAGTGASDDEAGAVLWQGLARTLATAQALDHARPASYVAVSAGPAGFSVEGFIKALSHEWEETVVRSIWIEGNPGGGNGHAAHNREAWATRLAAELASPDASLETRYIEDRRQQAVLQDPPAPSGSGAAMLPTGVVTVVTGGAGGIGGRIAVALAGTRKARVALLGRRAEDDKIRELLARVHAAGGEAIYVTCDVQRADDVAAAMATVRDRFGGVQAVVHAAGVVDDGPVGRKTDAGVRQVFDAKVTGALHLWHALSGDPLLAFFSLGSWAGRFGNGQQTDYATANHTLARLVETFMTARPSVRTSVLDLPPWKGSGMVRALPEAARKALESRITFLGDDEGVRFVLDQLDGASGEYLVGALAEDERRPKTRLSFHEVIDLQRMPYLRDHVIAGRPVLPLAGAVDMALGAAVAGGLAPEGACTLTHLSVVDGVVLQDTGARVAITLTMAAKATPGEPGAEFEIARVDAHLQTAFRGRMGGPSTPSALPQISAAASTPLFSLGEFYAQHTFHGPSLRVVTEVQAIGDTHARGQLRASAVGGGSPLVTALDGVLQLFAYWSVVKNGRGGLPVHASAIHVVRRPRADESLSCFATLGTHQGDRLSGDADITDASGHLVLAVRGLVAELREIGPRDPAGAPAPKETPPHSANGHAPSPLRTNRHDAQGHDTNGHDTNGHDTNGHDTNGHDTNGHDIKLRGTNGHDAHGHDAHGHDTNGHAHASTAVTSEARRHGNGHGNGHEASSDESPLDMAPERYRPEEFSEVKELEQRLALAKVMGIVNPYFRSHEGCNAATAIIKGRSLVNFSSYNYLGFSGHPEVNRAVKDAVDLYGSSVSASRVASGERPLHHALEDEIARMLGTERTLVMVGGHATNVSVLGHLLGPEDLVVHDSLAHDSIVGGVKLSGARRRPFAHNDPDALERILRETRSRVRRVLIAVEGVYSMDGDIAPLDRFIELKKKYGAMLFVDEAHSIGVLGRTGRGVGEHFDVVRGDVDLWMGTLSKSFASCGGYVSGSTRLIEYLRYTVPGFVYSVGISPANAAAALAAMRLMEKHPELPQMLHDKSRFFLHACRTLGIDTGNSEGSAVIPCIVRNSYACLQLSQALEQRGINVQPILYPAVEEDQARLRFFVSVTHTEDQLRTTAEILAEELFRLVPRPAGDRCTDIPRTGSTP